MFFIVILFLVHFIHFIHFLHNWKGKDKFRPGFVNLCSSKNKAEIQTSFNEQCFETIEMYFGTLHQFTLKLKCVFITCRLTDQN